MSARARVGRHDSVDSKTPRRQANACLRCYEKKVKCDMESLGQPCTGCARDGITCQKRTRKPYPPRKDSSNSISKTNASRTSPARASISSCTNPMPTPPRSIPTDSMPTPPRSIPSESMPTPMFDSEPFSFSPSYLESAPADFYHPVHDLANMVPHSSTVDTTMTDHMTPFLSGGGDDHALSYLMDTCDPGRDPTAQHFLSLKGTASPLDPAALAFAEAQGCFSMPSHAICEDLVQSYFHYVHPTLPIMNIADFLEQYTGGSFEHTSLLLLWSMFSVAANFASESTLVLSGCASREDLKKQFYGRAKCLFDFDYEQDKVTRIQSALLLGYWYSDLQDHAQAWHWTGIAISTAQSVGLHRSSDARHAHGASAAPQRRVWANIWWSCFFRDRWLSLGHGRPLRINAADCDVPMVGADCMLDLPEQAPQAWRKYVPQDLQHITPIWTGLLQLTVGLGEILSATYQPHRAPLDSTKIAEIERRVSECLPEQQARPSNPELVLFFESQARLHVEASMMALYRPYATEFHTSPAENVDPAVARLANGRIKAAATRASGILDRIITTDALRFAGPMMVPLLVPSMTVHLVQARSHDHFTSSWSKNRLELSLMILKRLEDNYPAAAVVHRLFSQNKNEHPAAVQFNHFSNPTPPSSLGKSPPNNVVNHWQGAPLDLHAPLNMGLPCNAPQWDSPDMGPGFDLWTMTPPTDGQMFFQLDDLHVSSV
ncbi:hypothetical protein BST61_g898 [Cercospora zeina]